MMLVEAATRAHPRFHGKERNWRRRKLSAGLLEYPHSHGPRRLEDVPVPDVLRFGRLLWPWLLRRREQSLRTTLWGPARPTCWTGAAADVG